MLLVTMENKRKYKNKMQFLEYELNFWTSHLEDDFEDEIIDRIFDYKFVLRTVYSFESGEEMWS